MEHHVTAYLSIALLVFVGMAACRGAAPDKAHGDDGTDCLICALMGILWLPGLITLVFFGTFKAFSWLGRNLG